MPSALHEEDYGILWKHTDRRLPDHPEVRRSRRLVVSPFPPLELTSTVSSGTCNQDGTIQFEIK